MIKKLRKKIILVSILSVSCVLFIMMAAINIWNYYTVSSYADDVLDFLYKNNGNFPGKDLGDFADSGSVDPIKPDLPRKSMNAETPYETRYFSVTFKDDEAQTDLRSIAAISSEQAIAYANKAIASGKTRGYQDIYRFLVANEGEMVIFVDCSRQIQSSKDFLQSSIFFSSIGLIAVFILVILLSNQAIQPIVASQEKQKRFITDASHELKTPLTIISANNVITELTVGESEATQTIAKQVEKMSGMIKNLTTLAKLDEAEKLKETSAFSLTDAIIDTAEQFRPSIENNNRTFNQDIQQNLVIQGDENLIRQSISILLENSTKYALSFVNLTLEKNGKNHIITISNDAESIEIGNLDKCFERFYRTDDARASLVSGNGIGLSIAKSIIELHKGTISAIGIEPNIFKIIITL